jgi:hypothetical protein
VKFVAFSFAALLLAPAIAAAQASSPIRAAQAGDPAAPAPAPIYRSVFRDLAGGVVADNMDWRKANAEVGQFRRGHMDVLKWEDRQADPGTATDAPGAPSTHMKH